MGRVKVAVFRENAHHLGWLEAQLPLPGSLKQGQSGELSAPVPEAPPIFHGGVHTEPFPTLAPGPLRASLDLNCPVDGDVSEWHVCEAVDGAGGLGGDDVNHV